MWLIFRRSLVMTKTSAKERIKKRTEKIKRYLRKGWIRPPFFPDLRVCLWAFMPQSVIIMVVVQKEDSAMQIFFILIYYEKILYYLVSFKIYNIIFL